MKLNVQILRRRAVRFEEKRLVRRRDQKKVIKIIVLHHNLLLQIIGEINIVLNCLIYEESFSDEHQIHVFEVEI